MPDADLPAPPPAADRVRWRDRLLLPPAPEDTAVITGCPARVPVRRDVPVTDPVSGHASTAAVWEYAADDGSAHRSGMAAALPRTLVVVHGFRGDHHGLALLADCLPEHRILSVELPGFGASPAFPAAEHTVAHHADALRQAVAGLVLDPPPVLVAHSYGSVVAAHAVAEAATTAAPLTDRLALLNPIAEPARDASGSLLARGLAAAARGYYGLAAALPERASRALLGAPPVVLATTLAMSRTRSRAVLGHTHDQHRRYFSAFSSAAMLAEAYRGSSAGTVLEVADRLTLPVLLVAGRQDPLGSPVAQRALADAVAAAGGVPELHVLDGVGHLLHYERAPECAALLRSWLAGP